MKGIYVFQVCESDAVAARNDEEAREWYKELTGFDEDELYPIDEMERIPFDRKVLAYVDQPQGPRITVGEIVEKYWNGKPFIAVTTDC